MRVRPDNSGKDFLPSHVADLFGEMLSLPLLLGVLFDFYESIIAW
jgi:hypothetical protein